MQHLKLQLLSGIERIGIETTHIQIEKLLKYMEILEKWNKTYNLTAVREPEQMISRHLLDSLSILSYVKGQRILDIGSGAGLPGIPLATLLSDKQFFLLDSNGKKTRFMQHVAHTLELKNVMVQNCRAESWKPTQLFDAITSRAFSSLKDMVQVSKHLLTSQGIWIAMKGVYPDKEIQALQQQYMNISVRKVAILTVPDCESKRHLVILGQDSKRQ